MSDYKKLVRYLKKVKVYCASCSLNVNTEDGDMMCKWGGEDRCLFTDAAAAIEALQAQLPKRGEWINSKERMRPDMCSVCGCIYEADRFMDKIAWNYCPNCGAKMMEVQE